MKLTEPLSKTKVLRSVRYLPGVLVSLAVVLVLFLGASRAGQAQEKSGMMGHTGMEHVGMHQSGKMHEGMHQGEMPHGQMNKGEMGMGSTQGSGSGDPQEGKAIYQRLCASCHGASGRGDGPVAQALNPRPSDFTQHMGNHGDDYFFKIIKQGGASVGKSSAMPAWGGQLEGDDIWDVISYLRTFQRGH